MSRQILAGPIIQRIWDPRLLSYMASYNVGQADIARHVINTHVAASSLDLNGIL
jgi:hypothetical protein